MCEYNCTSNQTCCRLRNLPMQDTCLTFRTATPRGRAVFASRELERGERLLLERPLLSMPLPESREGILSCERCCRPLGTLSAQACHLLRRAALPVPLPIDEEDDFLADDVPCAAGCGARFCSASCAALMAPSHRHLCRGGRAAKAIRAFEAHATSTYETFLFGARIVADVLARADQERAGCSCGQAAAEEPPCDACCAAARAPYDAFCRAAWWEISDEGVEKTGAERKAAREAAARSRLLLLACLDHTARASAERWLSLDVWGGMLGASRRRT